MDAICIGEILVDFVPLGAPGSYARHLGGAPANVAIALARNGLTVGFYGRVGQDEFGDFLVQGLESENVRLLCAGREQSAITTMVFVTLGINGERSFTFARKPGADMFLRPDMIRDSDLAECTFLHAGSCSLSEEPARSATLFAMKQAHVMGKIVSFDVNYREALWPGGHIEAMHAIREVLPYVDLIKFSEEEADMFRRANDLTYLHEKYNITAIVVTLGEKGAYCLLPNCTMHAPTTPQEALDTTGAGDAFWGNVLASLLLERVNRPDQIAKAAMERALRRGNLAGGISVRSKGAISGMPTRQQVERLLGIQE